MLLIYILGFLNLIGFTVNYIALRKNRTDRVFILDKMKRTNEILDLMKRKKQPSINNEGKTSIGTNKPKPTNPITG